MASPHVRANERKPTSSSPVRATALVPTTFAIAYDALSVFLVLRGEGGGPQLFTQMDDCGEGHWQLTLRLPLGQYRYRYYAVHERVTTYVSPHDVEAKPVQMCGIDGILTVREPRTNCDA